MFIITELNDQAIICYADGGYQVFCNRELATTYALALSANNNGVFSVQSLYDSRFFYYARALVEFNNRLKIRTIRLNRSQMVVVA